MPLRSLDRVGADLAEWASSNDRRVPTGYHFFDSRTSGGIAPGELCTLICHSGVGKTWFMVNVARNNPKVPTVLFSLEMHARYILQRLSAVHGDVPTSHIEQTLARGSTSDAVQQTIRAYPKLRIDDSPEMGFGDMVLALEEYRDETGEKARLVIVDYLELISSFAESSGERVDGVARQAKQFAREMDVALIVLHQTRKSEVRVPYMDRGREKHRLVANVGQAPLTVHDARFGGSTQSDYVLGMYRPSLNPELAPGDAAFIAHDLRFQLLKTRADGGLITDGIQHHWDSRTGRISELRFADGSLVHNPNVVPLHPEAIARQ